MSPHAERCQKRKRCGASSRPAMPQPAGASPARSSPASKRARKAATYASSSPTCRAGQKVLYEKVYCARGRMENLIKDMKLYTRSDRTSCHRWEANQFRLFLHMGGLLAPARTQGRRAKTLNLAHSNLRDHPLHVPQDRCAHPRAQDAHQDGAALKLSACSSLDRARHLNRRPRSMNDAASAALAPQLQTPTRRQCPRASTTVNPVDVMRSHRQSPALTNNWG